MIVCMRVDERLIHGQIAVAWSKSLDMNAIVVANDEAADNALQKETLKMAAPQNMKLAIRSLQDSVHLLQDRRCNNMKIFLLVDSIKDANYILDHVEGIPYVNIGNYGRVKKKQNRRRLNDNIFADEEDLMEMKKLIQHGIEVETRILPDANKVLLKTYLKEEQ